MSNPYAPPTVNESNAGNGFHWRIAGFSFITLGLMMPVILLTLMGVLPIGPAAFIALLVFSAGIAMYQRDLAQKALEQAELQQRRSSENPANE